jgi:O-antigen/teichoic acid export membrane protein
MTCQPSVTRVSMSNKGTPSINHTEIKALQKRRITQARLSGITTLTVKGITTIASIATIPLLLKYLGVERFGIWLILNMFLNWISIADLGLSNSLTNVLAIAEAKGDRTLARKSVSSTVLLMTMLSMLILVLMSCIYPFVEWEKLFNVSSSEAGKDIGASIIVCFILFVLRLTLSIPGFIYRAYQEGFIYQLWCGLGSVLSVLFLVVSINSHASLPWLIASFWGTLLLGDIFAGIYLFTFQRPWLSPNLKYFDWSSASSLFKMGFQFWIAQFCAILVFQTDLIIVDRLFGTAEVSIYGITLRLFSVILQVATAFTMPLWPAYCDAFSRLDMHWMTKTLKRSLWWNFIFSISSGTFLIVFSTQIFMVLANNNVSPSLGLMLAMLFTTVTNNIAQSVAALVNGIGDLKIQSFVAPISAFANLGLSIVLGLWLGVSGVAWATGICIVIFSLGIVGGDAFRKMHQRNKQMNMEVHI